ncbi:hypothetical protein SAMN05660772_02096 [Pasteurella testudinis DSM 23072]|uniref:IraD/Gp25-like domain-containing protein n=1 Tax=Pasteurella testudinis DSM 23072 TaxID=1122938 RepID=A0A1W1UMV4_9PAST|nr:GPW/gp25 family protein [Pasteurella testudinis]SMB82400.1 hypothetical protein SAMN05660772_02096 [Pasteurella testudinis DSM 23072]SUB52218.1 Gene 25-like lysozyme [Pasteurella testudinis]
MNRESGLMLNDETAHIRQSIADILQTAVGTRIQRREYGSILPMLLDRPISHALALQIAAASIVALQRWEPRIDITAFAVQFAEESKYRLTADISATTKNGNQSLNFNQLGLMQ